MATVSLKHEAQALRKVRIVLQNADVLTAQTAPISYIAAPTNVNNYVVIDKLVIEGVVVNAYTNNSAACFLSFNYGNSSGPVAANTTTAQFGTIISAANTGFVAIATTQTPTAAANLVAGLPIMVQITNAAGNLTGGGANNVIIVEALVSEYDASCTTTQG